MTIEDYETQKQNIVRQASKDKDALLIKFVDDNNPYKIGDTVTDHIGSIRYDELKYTIVNNIPTAVYRGVELKKDGTPKKRVIFRSVYGSNINR